MARPLSSRSMDLLRADGLIVDRVEQWIPGANRRRDLLGGFDLLALLPLDIASTIRSGGPDRCTGCDRVMPTPLVPPPAAASREADEQPVSRQITHDDPYPISSPDLPAQQILRPAGAMLLQQWGIHCPATVGVQVCSATGAAAHRRTMTEGSGAPGLAHWLACGNDALLLLWRKVGHRWQWAGERLTLGGAGLVAGDRSKWVQGVPPPTPTPPAYGSPTPPASRV